MKVQPAGGICVLLPTSELRETTTTTRLCVDSGHNAVNTPICSQTFVKMRPPLSLTGFVFLEKKSLRIENSILLLHFVKFLS